MAFRIIIEGSRTPIYRRIINGLARSFEKKGYQATTIEPDAESPLEFVRRVNDLKPDLVIISSLFGLLSAYEAGEQKYTYQSLESHVVFLHYDNVLGPVTDWDEIRQRLNSFVSISGRSSHFCIESSNSEDFQKLSTGNAHKMYHATEFGMIENNGKYRFNVSFVGHLMPESIFLNSMDPGNPLVARVLAAYKARLEHLDYEIEGSAIGFADQAIPSRIPVIDWLAAKQVYRAHINRASLFLRGRVISDVANSFDVDVVGGDPSYINDMPSTRQLKHSRVRLHTPDKNHKGTDMIYAGSRININITTIQFDSAVGNRVMDVAAVGGFLLTDWKDSLKNITSVHEQISYRTVDELNSKIDYYLTHEAERLELAAQLHSDVIQKFTYDHTTESILAAVNIQQPPASS
jgi:hypothetical protein